MDFLRRFPATVILIAGNIVIFMSCYLQAKTFEGPVWTQTLVHMGALFNPFTLDKEWYRLFSSMFLHGSWLHLALNMYGLFVVGSDLEKEIGTRKFVTVYFLSGVAAALASLYWNIFLVSVGASGAIFGLFGFSLIRNLFEARREGRSGAAMLINAGIFIGISLFFSTALHADNAGHIGGLIAGAALGSLYLLKPSFQKVSIEYLFALLLLVVFLALPRYQVHYYRFFQKILDRDDSVKIILTNRNLSDEQLATGLRYENTKWDDVLTALNSFSYLPRALHGDTFKIKHYIEWKKRENGYRATMVERESYIYIDSMEYVSNQIAPYQSLEHLPPRFHSTMVEPYQPDHLLPRTPVTVWFDENWRELPSGPGKFFRIGVRDSLNQWQGNLKDFYANGDMQMRGGFHNDRRDGIFIYYSDHHTYQSAGRYREDKRVGKWENFHHNGKLESEEYYSGAYFLKTYWDSTGVQQVIEGFGHVVKKHANGVIAEEGNYRNGRQQDLWVGRHLDGQLYFEEYFVNGRLTRGRSQNPEGKNFVYDESSYYPTPETGRTGFNAYLKQAADQASAMHKGRVRLSFRVTPAGSLVDIKIESTPDQGLDEKARAILTNGPRWIPAHNHGFEPIDGVSQVTIDFEKTKTI